MVDADLIHLLPSAQEIAVQDDSLRLANIRTDRWIGYTCARQALTKLEELLRHPKRQRMPNLLLIGPTNNGKSMIVEKFRRDHPPVPRGADKCLGETRTLCSVLAYTGCHLTEALELTFDRVDVKRKALIFESLKKRRAGVFRSVPVPAQLIETLDQVHNVRERRGRGRYRFLWSWSRTTAWHRVREVMEMAKISGPQATSTGLRHGFGVIAVESEVPLPWIREWMGHSSLEITASYASVHTCSGREIVARMWETPADETPLNSASEIH